jgi:predicted enzyme related to lactoylglutathione lyase
MITQVKHVTIPVKNQDAALKFYTEKLGFTVSVDVAFEADGQRWIELEIPNADTRVVLFTPQGHEDRIGSFSNVVFYSENVRKTYEELKAKGVEFTREPTEEPWGTYALLKDIDGNVFCLSST